MNQLTISLNDKEALREATMQAMLGVLSPEIKEKLLSDAIQALLAPGKDTWHKTKSPLELAFEQAVLELARQEVKRMVDSDAVLREKVATLSRATADKILSVDLNKMAERMADAFVASMRRD